MRHDFKVGVNYIDEPLLGGDFSTGTSGQYTLRDPVKGSPVVDIAIFSGFAGYNTPIKQYNYYGQDDISFNKKLTLNVGLRYDLWKGFDLDQTSNPIWKTLSTQTKYNDPYLKDFQGGKGGKLKNDTNNWAPRLGFTYDLQRRLEEHHPRRRRPLLRLPLHERHDPFPGRLRAVDVRTELREPRRQRHQERQRHLLPARPAAAAESADRRNRGQPSERGGLADAGHSLFRSDLARILVAGQSVARTERRRIAHQLQGHSVPLPRESDRSGHRQRAASRPSPASASGTAKASRSTTA